MRPCAGFKGITRRRFLAAAGAVSLAGAIPHSSQAGRSRPNVLLIITDDMAYGDLSCHGNPVLATPHLDALHAQSLRLTHFHVSPVCAPTRASLMTGRYNYRTGVTDTFLGRAMMHPEEVTAAELLRDSGYRTGIFGKWHLGDNYPMRPLDQGFEEALVHNGGGIGQPSDPPGNSYFDPVLQHNGRPEPHTGYCTDIFAQAAIDFIGREDPRPFFAYVAMNAPHSPLTVEERYAAPFLQAGLDERVARTYGMIVNIDENIGRMMTFLDSQGLAGNTLLIFLTDNGPCGSQGPARFNCGLRDRKGSVYDGGIRVPCFMRWPDGFAGGHDVDSATAHIDLLPTILDACGIERPAAPAMDGLTLFPMLTGEKDALPERYLFFQWHRGDVPERYNNCAVRGPRFKLVNGRELYDMHNDPEESQDLAADNPDLVAQMRSAYERWFDDVGSTRGYAPPRIHIGTPHENPVILTRQDWRGANGWDDKDLGYWEVHVARGGIYNVRLEFAGQGADAVAQFELAGLTRSEKILAGASACEFAALALRPGDGRLHAWVEHNGLRTGVRYVRVTRAAD